MAYPDPRLRKKAKLVKEIDASIKDFVRQMFNLMYKQGGVGLAATQVGKLIRLVVINLTKKPSDEIVLINPKIDKKTGEIKDTEGCLSLPGLTAKVRRYRRIVCRAIDLEGKEFSIDTDLYVPPKEAEDRPSLLARALQHEIDHLDGILFIDYLSDAEKKGLALQKL